MQNFVRNLLTEWRKLDLPFADATFVVAVSGGADSVSLLLALHELKKLKKLNSRFVVAHFNHNLRGEAGDADELFVKSLAGQFDFELALGKDASAQEKGNLEQNARDSRYRFLTETAENLDANAVLTAHTMNDQAETFLFNLLRGSGIEGLGAMRAVRLLNTETKRQRGEETKRQRDEEALNEHKSAISSRLPVPPSLCLIRPLLNWAKRQDTENFCRLNEIEFRYDAMNEDLKFNRVRIRKVLLPLLKDFNPQIVETLAQTARLLREDGEQLTIVNQEKEDKDQRPKTEDRRPILLLKDLRDVFPSMRRMILREWLKENRGNLRGLKLKHIEAIEKLIFSRKSGKIVELPKGASVIKQNGKLTFVVNDKESNPA